MTIAQSIRKAALTKGNAKNLGIAEDRILNFAFMSVGDWVQERGQDRGSLHWRTFMLLVAESLEPSLPVDDLRRAAKELELCSGGDWDEHARLAAVLRGLAADAVEGRE